MARAPRQPRKTTFNRLVHHERGRYDRGLEADMTSTPLLENIDAYCDAIPRLSARAEEIGSLVLFVPEHGSWPYYARPRRGARVRTEDVLMVRARQRALQLPETFEWIDEVNPSTRDAAVDAGLRVNNHPLMVLMDAGLPPRHRPPAGIEIRLATAEDDIATIGAVGAVAFSYPGTAAAAAGIDALRQQALARPAESVEFERDRLRAGTTVLAVALEEGVPVATGVHQPLGDVTEVVAVATLPSFRRRGLGAAVTAYLLADAQARGTSTIFLSAGSDEIANLYRSLGFRRIGTACAAEPM